MNTGELLFWWEDRPKWARRVAYAALALVVYGVLFFLVVQPMRQARVEASRQVDQLRSRLEQRRQQLQSYESPEIDFSSRMARVRGALALDSALRGADFESILLTRLSRFAEEAGVSSPIFNPAGVDTLLPPLGPDSGGLRAFTVEGQFDARSRALADFLGRLGALNAGAFVDTLSVRSALPEHRVYLRLRVLDPAGAVRRDTVPAPAAAAAEGRREDVLAPDSGGRRPSGRGADDGPSSGGGDPGVR